MLNHYTLPDKNTTYKVGTDIIPIPNPDQKDKIILHLKARTPYVELLTEGYPLEVIIFYFQEMTGKLVDSVGASKNHIDMILK